ncbi:hypothetical protein COP2_015327 [Malus domestica]
MVPGGFNGFRVAMGFNLGFKKVVRQQRCKSNQAVQAVAASAMADSCRRGRSSRNRSCISPLVNRNGDKHNIRTTNDKQ